jgi:hypothetical protein
MTEITVISPFSSIALGSFARASGIAELTHGGIPVG